MSIVNYITGKTGLLGVIGRPLSHSISPELHNTLSNYLGIDTAYIPLKVDEGNLKEAVNGLKALNFRGFNVTIPYKNDVIDCVDVISKEASLIGAVNTIKNVNNKLFGYNTDMDGFIDSFKEESGTDFKNKNVVILGAGGAARAIALGVVYDGAKKLYILNRTIEKALQIAQVINEKVLFKNIECFKIDDIATIELLEQADIIVNTTSLGMYPNINESPIRTPFEFSSKQIIYDVIYNPKKTVFMEQASNRGCKTINGLGMLIYQGIRAYEIWMDIKVPQDIAKGVFAEFTEYLT